MEASMDDDARGVASASAGGGGAPFPDESDHKTTDLDGLVVEGFAAAVEPTRDDSLLKSLELGDSSMDVKLEDLRGTLFPDDSGWTTADLGGFAGEGVATAVHPTREDSLLKSLELRDSSMALKLEDVSGTVFLDDSGWTTADLGAFAGEGVAVPVDTTREDSLLKSLELKHSPIDVKMEYIRGTTFPDDSCWKTTELEGLLGEDVIAAVGPTRENSLPKSLELGVFPLDVKMEDVSSIAPSCVGVGASLITESVPMKRDDGSDGDDSGSSESETDDSESDDSSSEEMESSSTSSSEEEEEQDEDDVGKGDDGEGLETILGRSDDDEEQEVVKGPIRSKNELENLPPVPLVDVSLELHHQMLPVGLISSILGNKVIVEGLVNHNPLNEGSILWITDTRSPLGLIDEIFGPVKNPYYVVRYNFDKDVPTGISEGTPVSFVTDFSCYIFDKDISKIGYDASGDNDEELNGEVEFSDDEKEAEYKRSLRQAKRGTDEKHVNQEFGTHKKKTNIKGRGSRKGMNQPMPGDRGNPMVHSGPNMSSFGGRFGASDTRVGTSSSIPAVARQFALSSDATNPPHQMLNQPNAPLSNGVLQPSAFSTYGMPTPLLHGVAPFGLPLQTRPDTAMTGFQMNCSPYQQVAFEAYHQQHENHRFSGNHNMLSYTQQFMPSSNMPSLGNFSNLSTGFMSPPLLGGCDYGQALLMCAQLGNSGPRIDQTQGQVPPHMQFNGGSSSVRGRKFHKNRGCHKFQGGTQKRNG